jgi:large subunit ribosomal protein L24
VCHHFCFRMPSRCETPEPPSHLNAIAHPLLIHAATNMQRVIQRAERAARVAARKKAKQAEHIRRGAEWSDEQTAKVNRQKVSQWIRDAKVNRRVDWETGPLAPRRDVGEDAGKYGSVHMFEFHPPKVREKLRPKWTHISEGDRVVVTAGRHKGKIAAVTSLDVERAGVTVKGVNVVDVQVPEYVLRERTDLSQERLAAMPRMIPLEQVKLVYPLPDPETGVPRDVVIDRLICVNRRFDKKTKKWDDGDRVIPGTNTIIPWPEKAEDEHEDHDADTRLQDVSEQTFQPYLLYRPMPMGVIDELRYKYSKFRTRHDWQFVEKMELEDARVERRKELIKGMRTPLQELGEIRKRQKEARERELSEEQLAKIGEVIAQESAKAMGAVRQMPAL